MESGSPLQIRRAAQHFDADALLNFLDHWILNHTKNTIHTRNTTNHTLSTTSNNSAPTNTNNGKINNNETDDLSLPLVLIEDYMERTPIETWTEHFAAIQKTIKRMAEMAEWAQKNSNTKTKLAMLRMCNGLLKRTSKTTHGALRGEILMLMAYVMPPDERSGVNVAGKFNAQSRSEEQQQQPHQQQQDEFRQNTETPSTATSITGDTLFHTRLWNMQKFLANPAQVREEDAWKQMEECMTAVLDAFESQKITEKDAEAIANSHHRAIVPKYLTSMRLMNLQLADATFRKNVLVQMAIMLHYLLQPNGLMDEKATFSNDVDLQKINNITGSCPSAQIINAAQQLITKTYLDRVYSVLRSTPPHGERFTEALQNLLQVENHWVAWKFKKCYSMAFVRSDLSQSLDTEAEYDSFMADVEKQIMEQEVAPGKTKSANVVDQKEIRKRKLQELLPAEQSVLIANLKRGKTATWKMPEPFFMGSERLAETMNLTNNWSVLMDARRINPPDFETYFGSAIAEEADATLDEELREKNSEKFAWKGLRLLRDFHWSIYSRADGSIGNLLSILYKERNSNLTRAATANCGDSTDASSLSSPLYAIEAAKNTGDPSMLVDIKKSEASYESNGNAAG